jgi:hypothetical protein
MGYRETREKIMDARLPRNGNGDAGFHSGEEAENNQSVAAQRKASFQQLEKIF